MAYSAVSVANSIIKLTKEKGINDLSPMKLQILMYFTQFFYLKNFEKTLIDDNFNRWRSCPVIPSLYYQLRSYQSRSVNQYIQQLIENNEVVVYMIADEDYISWALIDKVINKYGYLDSFSLSALTHRDNSSWSNGEIDTVITVDDMKNSKI